MEKELQELEEGPLPSTTFWLSKWVDAYKKQTYPNGWPKKRPAWSKKKKTLQKEPPKQL